MNLKFVAMIFTLGLASYLVSQLYKKVERAK